APNHCGKTQSLHCLPSDPNIRKEWMNFIFNAVPDRVSKNMVLCSLHFTADSLTNKAQFDSSERFKLKDDAVPNILDLTVMQHPSVKDVGCQIYTTVSQS
uniref:THAP-type domain-containing protein n=1 Tax=Sinocyclocheilus rhinocerous TaxID=307959 RepID=A0A673GND3_9TELE